MGTHYPKGRIITDRRDYSMTFWTVFFGFIMIPIMALGIKLGRYFYARAENAKVSAAEINQRVFKTSENLTPTSKRPG